MIFIKYSPKISHMKVIPLIPVKGADGDGYSFDNDTVTLRPGTNELSEKEWEAVKPHIKDLIGKEIVEISAPVKSSKGGKSGQAKSLKDVSFATAKLIVEGCQNPATLKKWFDQELPDELLLVVSKQMRKLKIAPDDLKDEDANLDALKGVDTAEENSDSADDTTGDESENSEEAYEDDTTDSEEKEEVVPDFDGSRTGDK